MSQKQNNNLIKVIFNGETHYFTSQSRVGLRFGINTTRVKYALDYGKTKVKVPDGEIEVYLVDGSKVLYEDIN